MIRALEIVLQCPARPLQTLCRPLADYRRFLADFRVKRILRSFSAQLQIFCRCGVGYHAVRRPFARKRWATGNPDSSPRRKLGRRENFAIQISRRLSGFSSAGRGRMCAISMGARFPLFGEIAEENPNTARSEAGAVVFRRRAEL